MTTPARLDFLRVLTVAEKAIAERLGHPMPEAILSIARVTNAEGGYVVHVNSGGNAIVVESALRQARYDVDEVPWPPGKGHYGVRIAVRLPRWALDEVTEQLRLHDWDAPVVYACGCHPHGLCPFHADRRAVDHYTSTS